MDENSIAQLIEKEFGKLKEFHPSILIDTKNKFVEIHLEDCAYYAEWIKGEGGDISIYRANDDNRVVGAFLPLRIWKGKFPIEII